MSVQGILKLVRKYVAREDKSIYSLKLYIKFFLKYGFKRIRSRYIGLEAGATSSTRNQQQPRSKQQ